MQATQGIGRNTGTRSLKVFDFMEIQKSLPLGYNKGPKIKQRRPAASPVYVLGQRLPMGIHRLYAKTATPNGCRGDTRESVDVVFLFSAQSTRALAT